MNGSSTARVLARYLRPLGELLPVVALLVAGCSRPHQETEQPGAVAVQDFRGAQIVLDHPATRIVCLLESALSGLYMLHAGDRLVGIPTTAYDDANRRYYAALDPRIASHALSAPGNWDFVNLESVVALQPDLVIIWREQPEVIAFLERHGIPVYAVFLAGFSDVHRELRDFGILTATQSRAESLLTFVASECEEIAATRDTSRSGPAGYFMWSQGPLETSGTRSTVQELFTLAGVRNVCRSEMEHVVAHLEDVLLWDPELIIRWNPPHPDARDLEKRDGWKSVRAVRTSSVYTLPAPFLCDFWTLKYVIAARHVGAWAGGSPEGETDQHRILRVLYGKDPE